MSVQARQEIVALRTGPPFVHTEIRETDVPEYLGHPEPLAPYMSDTGCAHRVEPRTGMPTSGRRHLLRVDRAEV